MRATIAGVPPPYAAYLRVYDPLPAFPPGDQAYWRQYVAAERAPRRYEGARLEQEHALRRMLSGRLPDPGEQAFVTARAGVPLICPWRTALRAYEAVEAFRAGMADLLAEALVPSALAERAHGNLTAWRDAHPHARSHIVTSTWTVPVRWFSLFGGEDRLLRIEAGERELVYVTDMAKARRRAARALASLRKGLGQTDVAAAMERTARWLEEFHPRALVELDYGGLVWLFDDEELVADDSAEAVAVALRAFAIGDAEAASAAYDRVSERWRWTQ